MLAKVRWRQLCGRLHILKLYLLFYPQRSYLLISRRVSRLVFKWRLRQNSQSSNMRYAEMAWVGAIFLLLSYEMWALFTGHMTLSRAVWTADASPYGKLLPLLTGILVFHFFGNDVQSILALFLGFVGGGIFWHKVN